MSTISPRLLMTLPEFLDPMNTGDNVLSDCYDKIDTNCHCRIVSSLGSVANPFNGLHVRNTGDNKNYLYKNNGWVEFSSAPGSNPGVVGYQISISTTSGTSLSNGSESQIIPETINVVSGHRYLITYCVSSYLSSPGTSNAVGFRIRTASGSSTTTSSDLIDTMFEFQVQNRERPFSRSVEYIAGATEQRTFTLYAYLGSGSSGDVVISNNSTTTRMYIYDYTPI